MAKPKGTGFRVKKGERVRIAACLVWLEDIEAIYGPNAYGELLGYLAGLHIPCVCSPIHDLDTYTADDVRKWVDRHIDPDYYDFIDSDIEKVRASDDCPKVGDKKKAHIHVMFKLDGPVQREKLSGYMADFYHVPETKWEKVLSYDSMLRYFCHMDNADKHRYSECDVMGFGGIDMSALLRDKPDKKISTLCEVVGAIKANDFKHYCDVIDWAFSIGDYDIITCVTGRASFFSSWFNSRNAKKMAQDAKKKESEAS